MAIADAPRPAAPVPVAPPRSRRRLEEQKATIRLALRSLVLDDDSREEPFVLPGRGEPVHVQRPRRTQGAFCATIHTLLDQLPRHVVVNLPAAVARLPSKIACCCCACSTTTARRR
jgi:hypothetical protein